MPRKENPRASQSKTLPHLKEEGLRGSYGWLIFQPFPRCTLVLSPSGTPLLPKSIVQGSSFQTKSCQSQPYRENRCQNHANYTRDSCAYQVQHKKKSEHPLNAFLLMTNRNTSPAPHHQNQPSDFGSGHESQQQQLQPSLHRSHRHTCCVRVRRVFYNFPCREAAQLMCLAALRFS